MTGRDTDAVVQIFHQTTGGGLAAPVPSRGRDVPETLEASDFNGDGLSDLAILHRGGEGRLGLGGAQSDPDLSNNSASATVTVTGR